MKAILIFAASCAVLTCCGCATTNENGEPTAIGRVLNGATSTMSVICSVVDEHPEEAAGALEVIGGVLSVVGLGGISGALFMGANALRKRGRSRKESPEKNAAKPSASAGTSAETCEDKKFSPENNTLFVDK